MRIPVDNLVDEDMGADDILISVHAPDDGFNSDDDIDVDGYRQVTVDE